MYNVNIYPECKCEEEYVAILSVISNMLDNEINNDFIVRNFKRTQVNVPVWSAISRHERFENKF